MISQNKIPKIAIFASGNGSNAESLLMRAKELDFKISCILTDNPNAGVIKKARRYNTPVYVIPFIKKTSNTFEQNKSNHEFEILKIMKKESIEWILLAGYMRILSKNFLKTFYNPKTNQNNIINIHPSLLPSFPGKQGYLDAFNANVQESGITIHFVDNGVDSGLIIAQKKFERHKNDSLDRFIARGLKIEHALYPSILENLINNPKLIHEGLQ